MNEIQLTLFLCTYVYVSWKKERLERKLERIRLHICRRNVWLTETNGVVTSRPSTPLCRQWGRRRDKRQWRSTGEHKSQKWIREHWQWYWCLIYITNLIRYARHVQKPETRQELGRLHDTAGSPFGIVFVLPEGTAPFNCEGTYHFRGRAEAWFISVCDGRQKTCPPSSSSSPSCTATWRPPPPPWCLMLLRSNKAFFPSYQCERSEEARTFLCLCVYSELWAVAALLSGFTRCISNRAQHTFFFFIAPRCRIIRWERYTFSLGEAEEEKKKTGTRSAWRLG